MLRQHDKLKLVIFCYAIAVGQYDENSAQSIWLGGLNDLIREGLVCRDVDLIHTLKGNGLLTDLEG